VRGMELTASPVANPAFDVTPRRYVTGLITERGIATPATLAGMFGQ
jgi:methylthioribose-1-phosphate isomerase